MPVMFAFQSIAEVPGAGPAEKREKAESPVNWGQSYRSKISPPEEAAEFVVSPETLTKRAMFKNTKKFETASIRITSAAVIKSFDFIIFSPRSVHIIVDATSS